MILLLLAACAPGEASWLDGFGFRWENLNHRVSHVGYGLEEDAAVVAIVGGTSTTGVAPDLADTCDPEGCEEFPLVDDAEVALSWTAVSARGLRAGHGSVGLTVGSDETVGEVVVPMRAGGEAVAFLRGWSIDTDVPHAGEPGCYDPAYGWLPRRLAVALGEPVVERDAVRVPVTARFVAGNTLEDERRCLDAVSGFARVALEVDVQVLAGDLAADRITVEGGEAWASGCPTEGELCTSPDPQPVPDPEDLGAPASAVAWTGFDLQFHVDHPQDRGAYLRELTLTADAELGEALVYASNSSPTQLSGFDYTFEASLVALDLPGTVTRGGVTGVVEAALDDAGTPVRTRLPLQ